MRKYELTCSSDPSCIAELDRWLKDILFEAELGQARGFCCAAHELVINSVNAIMKLQTEPILTVECVVENRVIYFSVIDSAHGLSDEQVERYVYSEEIEEPEDPLQEFGRGYLLIRKYSDRFLYEGLEDGRFKYTIIKQLT